jgi:hypothetical protein
MSTTGVHNIEKNGGLSTGGKPTAETRARTRDGSISRQGALAEQGALVEQGEAGSGSGRRPLPMRIGCYSLWF